jgi:plasmid stabilization system protein ParE
MRGIRLLESADADIARIVAWLDTMPQADSARWRARIVATIEQLAHFDIGRPSRAKGLREVSVRGAPYVISYRIEADDVLIFGVHHTRQNRP